MVGNYRALMSRMLLGIAATELQTVQTSDFVNKVATLVLQETMNFVVIEDPTKFTKYICPA